ncbi:unnamed protein product [Brassica napus]|uniref:(rape) hypothetical protein n=1 Tax=Brassica napus TaxID=3708 RepID=A0A816RFB5_BRANA|nr:unnamed protein product [Brassica napus]
MDEKGCCSCLLVSLLFIFISISFICLDIVCNVDI